MGLWDFVTSPGGGALIGGLVGGAASLASGGRTEATPSSGRSQSTGSTSGRSTSGSTSNSRSNSWSGTAQYMKPYTTGEQGVYPLAQQQYLENMGQGYFGQTPEQLGINADTAGMLQYYLTNPDAVQQSMDQAGSFGDRYASTLQGTDPNVQNSMNQFLGGEVDTNTLDALQQAATNRAMVGYGDAVQDAGDMYTNQIAPSIRSGAMLSGQYGGSRQGVAEGVSSGMLNQQLARNARDLGLGSMDVGTSLYSDAYQQARDNQYGMAQFGAGYGLDQNLQGMQKNLQNAGIEQAGGEQLDAAANRYLAGQQGAYNAFGRNVADAQAEQDFGWQQLMNYFNMINGQGQESTASSSSSSSSWGDSSNSGSNQSRSVTSGSTPSSGYGLLEGIGYGAGIGQGFGGLDYSSEANSRKSDYDSRKRPF